LKKDRSPAKRVFLGRQLTSDTSAVNPGTIFFIKYIGTLTTTTTMIVRRTSRHPTKKEKNSLI